MGVVEWHYRIGEPYNGLSEQVPRKSLDEWCTAQTVACEGVDIYIWLKSKGLIVDASVCTKLKAKYPRAKMCKITESS